VDDHLALHKSFNRTMPVYPEDGEAALSIALAAGGAVLLSGTYQVTGGLVVANDTHIHCTPGTVIQATAEMDVVLTMEAQDYDIQNLHIEGLTIDGNSLAVLGAQFYKVSIANLAAIDGLYIKGTTSHGLVLQACQCAIFRAIRAVGCGGDGILAQGCNGSMFYGLTAVGCAANGITVEAWTDPTTETHYKAGGGGLYGFRCETNGGYGLNINTEHPLGLFGGWLEDNVSGAMQSLGDDPVTLGVVGL
jgi:hypothetical protein